MFIEERPGRCVSFAHCQISMGTRPVICSSQFFELKGRECPVGFSRSLSYSYPSEWSSNNAELYCTILGQFSTGHYAQSLRFVHDYIHIEMIGRWWNSQEKIPYNAKASAAKERKFLQRCVGIKPMIIIIGLKTIDVNSHAISVFLKHLMFPCFERRSNPAHSKK